MVDHKITDCFGKEVTVTERLACLRKLAAGRQSRWRVGSEGWRREQAVKDQLDSVLQKKKTYVPAGCGGQFKRVFIVDRHKKEGAMRLQNDKTRGTLEITSDKVKEALQEWLNKKEYGKRFEVYSYTSRPNTNEMTIRFRVEDV